MPDTVFRSSQPQHGLDDKTDAFGHRDYAAVVVQTLLAAEAPFTLGLYGPWGVGKSTIIHEVGRQLAAQNSAVVEFDAWRYDSDALRRHFFREAAGQLKEAKELERGYPYDEELRELDVDESSPGDWQWGIAWDEAVRLLVGSVLFVAVVAAIVYFGELSAAEKLAITAVGALVALSIALFSPALRVIQLTRSTEVRRRTVDPELFTAKFERLLAAVKKPRIVFAIDNLDRCSPERVTELLETLNTYLEPAGAKGRETTDELRARRKAGHRAEAVFLVAADDAALRRHIEAPVACDTIRAGSASSSATSSFACSYWPSASSGINSPPT